MLHHETSHGQQDLLNSVAEEVARADDLQALSRPLLDLLQRITGLSSVYLTEIDWQNDRQHTRYSRNTGGLVIPEGLSAPWSDTLCRRSLDENRRITTDVGTRWAEPDAARELGIKTYASVPVRTQDGEIFGTLCAASNRRESVPDNAMPVMDLFAQLIAFQAQRQRDAEQARARAEAAEKSASMFAALSRIGTVCSRSEGLAPALRECAEILATLYPHATVTPLLAESAGEDAADAESAAADNGLDRDAALDWTERAYVVGRLADGGGGWQRDSAAWRDAGLDELAANATRDVGVACAVHC